MALATLNAVLAQLHHKNYIKCLQAADMKDFEPLIKYFKEDQLKLYSAPIQ